MSRNKTDNKLSGKAAEDLQNVIQEAKSWIEAVTGMAIGNDFRQGLENGVILCELLNRICPNSIRKINRKQIAIAHLDNLKQFLNVCESLGLKDSQLFNVTDLQDPGTLRSKTGGVKHTTADRRLHNVCITLYWLGRRISQLPAYEGPQLNLDAFRELLDLPQNQSYQLQGYEIEQPSPTRRQYRESPHSSPAITRVVTSPDRVMTSPDRVMTSPDRVVASPDRESSNKGGDRRTPTAVSSSRSVITATVAHVNNSPSFPTLEALSVSPPTTNGTFASSYDLGGTLSDPTISNGVGNELDTLADQLLANIQSTVDELMMEYGGEGETTAQDTSCNTKVKDEDDFPLPSPTSIYRTVDIISPGGSFGLQLIGGINTTLPAQVEVVLPGLPAEASGIEPGDLIVSVDGVDVTNMTHDELIAQIKSCAAKKRMSLGIVRRIKTELDDIPATKVARTESSILWEEEHQERDRQRQEVARLYQRHSQGSESINSEGEDITNLDTRGTHWSRFQDMMEERGVVSEPVTSNHVESLHNGIVHDEGTSPNALSDLEQERGEGEGKEADTDSEGPIESDPFQPVDTLMDQSSYLLSEVMSSSKFSQNSNYNSKTTPISYTSKTTSTPYTSKTSSTYTSSVTPTHSTPPIQQSNSIQNAKEVGVVGEEEIIGDIKVKAVQRTRWTPENSRANVNRSASLLNNGSSSRYSNGDSQNGYERHEVVMSDPRNARARSWSDQPTQNNSLSMSEKRPTSGVDRKRLSCSHCRAPITHGPMMSIQARNLNFHARCLQCVVCRTKLTPDYGRTTVYLRHSLPHCSSCYSTDSGIKTTTC